MTKCKSCAELRKKLSKAEEQCKYAVAQERGKGMVAIKEGLNKLYAKMQLEIQSLEEIRNKEYVAKVQLENELRERRSELSTAESKAEMYKEDFDAAIEREDALEGTIEKRKAFQAEWRNRALIAECVLYKIIGMASRSHMCHECGYPMNEVFPGIWRCSECGCTKVATIEETEND
tara:strand:- start:360 stop:887 length:528 start_codon:yes stop_codon:yes gene_type:complete